MSIIRPFGAEDLLKINAVNIDPWTETYSSSFYLQYLSTWPDYSCVATGPHGGRINAYVIGKHEPPEPHPLHHGHVTALSVSPPYRGLGLAKQLMSFLEQRSGPDAHDTWFVDLFVRCINGRAIAMYEKMGYSVFRRVVGYYNGMEGVGNSPDQLDGFDMRKSMARDTDRKHVRSNGREVRVRPEEVWQ
ncbi:N-alpha-acetyltransferase 20 [Naganishia albida]|nr:N-alpha-acetyltransferase 20 [Naganishia albida]